MTKTITLFFLALCLILSCTSPKVQKIDFSRQDYLFNFTINKLLKDSKDGGLAATKYSFVSEHERAMLARDYKAEKVAAISDEEWKNIKDQYHFVEAQSFIAEQSKAHDFLLINEAHYSPHHRYFLKTLLPALWNNGYRYLALEAIGMTKEGYQFDTAINTRAYPIKGSGYYTQEPVFSMLIRSAIKIGFKIFGYDTGSGEEREINGAKNIIAFLEQQPEKGKTIVLCGWDHIKEGETGTYWGFALAGRLQQFLNTDPLSINQTRYSPRTQISCEDPVYQKVDIEVPSILINKEGKSFTSEKNPDWYDFMVFHPRAGFKEGIPKWMLDEYPITKIELPQLELKGPCKVFLFEEGDDIHKATPVYVRELRTIKEPLYLPINDGQKKIVISNGLESWLYIYKQ